MHKSCACPCLISEVCKISTWTWILLQWIWGTQNTNNLHFDSCSLSSFVKIGLCFIHNAFSHFLWLHMAPTQEPFLHLTFGESWWSPEMLQTSPPGWSPSSFLLDSSLYWSSSSRLPCYLWPTDVSCDSSHQMCFIRLGYLWSLQDKLHSDCRIEPEPNSVWYRKPRPILKTIKLILMPQL